MKESRSSQLHPAVADWFKEQFSRPTAVQGKAWPHTLAGENVLILAPTGSGKTLAAFLSVLSELGRLAETGALPNAVCAVYVSPLRSLDRDIHRNLMPALEALNRALPPAARIRMEVRTGDTEPVERARQRLRRPHLLLTTPESLASLLSQRGWRDGFAPFAVVVDEIHAFAESKRGSLLALTLERLERKAPSRLQRIGLSATAWPVEAVKNLLCGARPCQVAAVRVEKAHRLEILIPPRGQELPPAGYNPFRVAYVVAEAVRRAECSLVFTSTRSACERVGLALRFLLPEWEEQIAVHHSSVEREERMAIEEKLSEGGLKAVVASSSLELGVDFQAVDQVLMVGTPWSVSAALQRLGRSGHRVDGVARGALVPLSLPDLLRAVALRHAVRQGLLDALRVPRQPLDVLAQALLGMSIEGPQGTAEVYEMVRRAGPYQDLSRSDFQAVLEYLAGGGPVLSHYPSYGKIVLEPDGFRVASRKAERDYYLNIGTISDDYQIRVVTRNQRRLGEVEESFLSSLQPGEAFVMGGRAVVIERWHGDVAIVRAAEGERVQTPRWMGSKFPLTTRLASEEVRLRRELRQAWERGGGKACRLVLEREWGCSREAAQRLTEFIARQYEAAPIPIDRPVQVERVREGRSLLILFHSVAGRAVNRALAWVVGRRLGIEGSMMANHDDHAFLIAISARDAPSEERLRRCFHPDGWMEDVRAVLEASDTLGRIFRPVAEIGQLLPRRTFRGCTTQKQSSWNAALLYTTLRRHDPEHPLVRETIRYYMEDQMELGRALRQTTQIFESEWEVYDLPRPSPFALPLFAAFSRETLAAQDPDRALDELVARLYGEWEGRHAETA